MKKIKKPHRRPIRPHLNRYDTSRYRLGAGIKGKITFKVYPTEGDQWSWHMYRKDTRAACDGLFFGDRPCAIRDCKTLIRQLRLDPDDYVVVVFNADGTKKD